MAKMWSAAEEAILDRIAELNAQIAPLENARRLAKNRLMVLMRRRHKKEEAAQKKTVRRRYKRVEGKR